MKVRTQVDGILHEWELESKVFTGFPEAGPSIQARKVFNAIGSLGWTICSLPENFVTAIAWRISRIMERLALPSFPLADYHKFVDEITHFQVIEFVRELRFKDLECDPFLLQVHFSELLGIELNPVIAGLDQDHVQLRIVRPMSTDFNPPHRDSYLTYYENVVNVWVPICVTPCSIMPVCNFSHLWPESEITRTAPGEAKIGGNKYRVPAVTMHKLRELKMIRPKILPDQCLVFSPYLIHGFGLNKTSTTRFALELRFGVN